jgi:hypothetical protein
MNMTGSNLFKLLVVANLAARRLDLCKDTRDPSVEIFPSGDSYQKAVQ